MFSPVNYWSKQKNEERRYVFVIVYGYKAGSAMLLFPYGKSSA